MSEATIIRISTDQSDFFYALDTDAEALDAFAVEAGYKNYADLASVEGKTVEQSLADLHVSRVTYREAASKIIDEALVSNAVEDGASDRFETSRDWADWCLEGKTGSDVNEFAKGHKLDADLVRIAVAEALGERSVDDINSAFPLQDGVFESEDGTEALDPEAELPSVFFHRVGGTVTRFWYTGQETYDCHERREDEHGQVYWYGLGSRRITDDTTAEEFEEFEAA